MVLPSAATRSWKRRRNGNIDILVVIVVTAIVVSAAWLVALTIIGQSQPKNTRGYPEVNVQPDSSTAPATKADATDIYSVPGKDVKVERPDVDVSENSGAMETDGEMHLIDTVVNLSAKNMLATKRPYLIYGTAWKKDDTADLVFQAVHSGFRFFDTACQPKHYDEAGVGYGWKTAAETLGLSREDFFLQTKFTSVSGQDPDNIPYEADAELEIQVRQSIHTSLRNLQTDYIDSLVLHSPMRTMDETMRVWKVFEDYVEQGKILQLGISNCYKPTDLESLHQQSKIKPKVLQNRFHKKTNFDVELRKICESLGVQYQSFWTLSAQRDVLAGPTWKSVAKEKGLTPQTLMYAFMMTLGHIPLSGTKNADHMHEDVDIMLRFQHGEQILSEDEMTTLSHQLDIRPHSLR